MQQTINNIQKHFFKDKDGKVVLWQAPNALFYTWLVLKVLGMWVLNGHLQESVNRTATVILFAWAYLEMTKGVNYFRKLLGLLVLVGILWSFFK